MRRVVMLHYMNVKDEDFYKLYTKSTANRVVFRSLNFYKLYLEVFHDSQQSAEPNRKAPIPILSELSSESGRKI